MLHRYLAVLACVFLGIMLLRQEQRMDRLEDAVDELHQIIKTQYHIDYTKTELDCLTRNIYYEAGNQDTLGRHAVATVTLNRLRVGRWGNTVCKVVYAPAQFSWTLQHRLARPDPAIYADCEVVARQALEGHRVKGLERSLMYHADYIREPFWADAKNRIGQIGRHIFYTKGLGSTIDI